MPTTDRRNAALATWYRRDRRDLPWRRTSDPYHILVAEVMLQQTQVDRVVPRYLRFLERFPNASALAAAPLRDVLAEWNGLGYNARAGRLRQAAAAVVESGWPETVEGLRRLPGIGPYTAAAVASFAFGAGVAAIDTNLRRVVSRWEGRPLRGAALEAAASALVPEDAAEWNQAMMDLGATVCRPRNPRCEMCPVAHWCADPTVETPAPPQAPFEGSLRQVRGAVLRHLTTVETATPGELASALEMEPSLVREAVRSLTADGMVVTDGGACRIPE